MKNLGPVATEHLTALYNDSLKYFRLPSIWKTSLVIPIPKPGKDSSQGTSYRPIWLICPAATVLEALILPSINEFISPAKQYKHGFRPRHSTTPAILQLTTDIETGFNQQKPPHRTVCVAIDLTAAFDTLSHAILISNIAASSLPPAITRWLSCYLRVRQVTTSFRGTKSSTRIVRTGVPEGSKLSPSLFNYYIADMPRPTPRSRGFVTLRTPQSGLLDQNPTAGVHDQQLPERCRHLPEGKLAFDLCAEVNSHAIHPEHTPIPDASQYYS